MLNKNFLLTAVLFKVHWCGCVGNFLFLSSFCCLVSFLIMQSYHSPLIQLFYLLLLYMQVKSRMMGDSSYKSTLDCFIKTLKNDVWLLCALLFFSLMIFTSIFLSISINRMCICSFRWVHKMIHRIWSYQIVSGDTSGGDWCILCIIHKHC